MVQIQFRIFWKDGSLKIVSETLRGDGFSQEEIKVADAIETLQLQAMSALGKDAGMKVRTRKRKTAAQPSTEKTQ